ncbi:MAG: hypothetical protein BGO98_18825 [Myxococcales bacterium 68-20]|nr:MAG: hypothetical protein BGO98_18825 [Myxococcales bacterium 68-20]
MRSAFASAQSTSLSAFVDATVALSPTARACSTSAETRVTRCDDTVGMNAMPETRPSPHEVVYAHRRTEAIHELLEEQRG